MQAARKSRSLLVPGDPAYDRRGDRAAQPVALAVLRDDHEDCSPIAQEVLSMCEEWWMRRRRREAEEDHRLWDEFERTRPVSEPDRPDEREVTLEERDETPTAARS
jgi:hypothetical protein